jgi:hypothetical protein
LDEETEAKIDKLWHPDSVIKTVEIHELITRNAKDLMRQIMPLGYSLKPGDAIHLVTAQFASATEFHTYDHRLFKFQQYLGFGIGYPHVDALPLFPTPGSALRGLRQQETYWLAYRPNRDERPERHPLLSPPRHRLMMKNRARNRMSIR